MGSVATEEETEKELLGDASLAQQHELSRLFAAHGFALNSTLVEMLDEHLSHRTERRGCGFTQATRHLAVLVNKARENSADAVERLFPEWARSRAGRSGNAPLQRALHALPALLEREESRILAALITDLVVPVSASEDRPELRPTSDDLKIGTCPLAEKYFLEITDKFVRRKGRANVLISEQGEPLLVEKLNLGDDHSCISVAEVVLNGVRLPPGCLFGVHYEGGVTLRENREVPGGVIPVGACSGFRFLRLTTLAVSPGNRERAFSRHFRSQVEAGLFAPGEATIEQLRRVALEQL